MGMLSKLELLAALHKHFSVGGRDRRISVHQEIGQSFSFHAVGTSPVRGTVAQDPDRRILALVLSEADEESAIRAYGTIQELAWQRHGTYYFVLPKDARSAFFDRLPEISGTRRGGVSWYMGGGTEGIYNLAHLPDAWSDRPLRTTERRGGS